MAPKSEQLLIVLSILEGRDFPKLPRLRLEVQASFDGEQLTTDPVEHLDQPHFSTELAWELDRKMLHQHRLQRTPIKLQCFAVEPSSSSSRENVGYIVLDLRSVQEVPQDPHWHALLSSKYTKKKPSLLLSMVLENDSKSTLPSLPPATPQSPQEKKAQKAPRSTCPPVPKPLPDKLEAVLVPEQGYHQVGPDNVATDMFVLSVTVAFAAKLEQLIPTTLKLSSEDAGFFFFYTLLGNDITSEPFQNLLTPDFQPERASVRICSSERVLRTFMSQQPPLQIHLCCGTHSLGSADVPLATLAGLAVDLEDGAATVEGVFTLQPPSRVKRSLPPLPADLQPNVSVAVTLRREDVVPQLQALSNKEGRKTNSCAVVVSAAEDQLASSTPSRNPPDVALLSPQVARPPSRIHQEPENQQEALSHDVEALAPNQAQGDGDTSSVLIFPSKPSIPPSAHHYCFSLDICSLRQTGLTHTIAATVRYSYEFFGSAVPVMTSRPVELHRNTDLSLPHSYCAFDFAAVPQQLQDTFLRVPLVLELWHKDTSSTTDLLIGRASLQLSRLLAAERSRHPASMREAAWRQTHQDRVPFFSTLSSNEKVAELSYAATLDDFGLVNVKDIPVSDSAQNEPTAPLQETPTLPAPPTGPPAPPVPTGPPYPRDTMEYRTALELELWKETQEDLFNDQLRKKEFSHMQALAEEWMRREHEREAWVKKKEMECSRLEEQLQKTLADLEEKEKHLIEAELKTQRLQRDLRAEHKLTQQEAQETIRRLQLECDHRMALEREKARLMEEERTRLLKQITDGENRYKQLEKDFLHLREQQNVRPEVRLQTEIKILSLEKVELERKLESTTKSKLYYKEQWGRALKDLTRFKQENAMMLLKKQQAEMDAMRLRSAATEEKEAVRQERQELGDIMNQLNRLKQQGDIGPATSAPAPSLNHNTEEHLSRLLEERDTLLRTGVYGHDDRIIAELNRQIGDAMAGAS
ncbi:centrosomal protein of 120 kDa isoform X2 [Phyllopteryx taeniolatus]|uniref:centrosomal protein of 120 kDa isoform X2 n=1 Tax=Phyllopteryx taeniolatus TaxID=161469 RepID=UPI002AD2412B|nr:centrosomal protein of 120 kDa isoform X2 [Phyllopteryx taeniolatus]